MSHKLSLPLPTGGAFLALIPASARSGDIRMVGATLLSLADLWQHAEARSMDWTIQVPTVAIPDDAMPWAAAQAGKGGA